jgi:hypothetical protein
MRKPAKKAKSVSSRKKTKSQKSTRSPAKKAAPGNFRPLKLVGGKVPPKRPEDRGPLGWLLPMLETAYTPVVARGAAVSPAVTRIPMSSLQRNTGGMLAAVAPDSWRNVLLEFKRRKAAAAPPPAARPMAAGFVPGARNWLPLGPSVVLNGQTVGSQPVGGRVAGLAIGQGGSVIYAASANGGVFRSSDGGTSWRALMDRFDMDPTSFASSSLACGAIAIDPSDPNRVYVGTGEGDTYSLFSRRITNALPAYRGVGPIRTDDGGVNWIAESSSPDLAGEAFFALAVDPRNRDNVLGATTRGLYRRTQNVGGQFEWPRVMEGVFSSVVVASDAANVRFFAAQWGENGAASRIMRSDDAGATWSSLANGFPADANGRVALGVQSNNPNLIYAFAVRANGAVHGLYRLDDVAGTWKPVAGLPDVLPVDGQGGSQGDYG